MPIGSWQAMPDENIPQPMRITLVSLSADPSRGGAEAYTVDLARRLAGCGQQVTLISGEKSASCATRREAPGGDVHVTVPARGITRSRSYLNFVRGVEEWIRKEPQDIVHAMLPMPSCDIYHPHAGIAMAAIQGKPVQTLSNPRRRLFAKVEHQLLTGAEPPVILCLSDYIKAAFLRYYPEFPGQKMVKLFNAVNLDHYPPAEPKEPTLPVEALIVAQDFERKGLATVIHAMADAPGVKLTVVGRDDPGKFRRLAQRLGVADRVEFAGPQTDVRPFYHRADFLVLPTRHDPCSLVVLEALAVGLPVISTRFNGACEIMENGVHGWILDHADDPRELAAAMNRLADPTALKATTSHCATLRPALSYENHLQTLMGVYESLLSERKRA
jgi:UDP-glucose:(heptosyl)LPS alpha-1,3-glucosyltransferase